MDIWACLALLCFAMIVMLPGVWLGHISGHSSHYNISWAAEFTQRLEMGAWWPRWLPGMNAGAGSPVFYFYGPLPFYLSAPFFLLIADEALAMIGATWLVLVLSGLACFALLRRYVATTPALLAAGLYMILPYHFHADIWIRAAYGEQAAFIFLPLCALWALHPSHGRINIAGLALSYAGLLLSHLPSALLFAPFLALLCLWTAVTRRQIQWLVGAILGGMIALGLGAAYILPALAGQDFVRPQQWDVFAPENSLLFQPSSITPFFSVAFLATVLLLAIIAVALWRTPDRHKFAPWLAVALLIILIVTPISRPLWEHAGVFRRAQFAWRILSLLDLSVAVGFALLLARPSQRFFRLLAAGLAAVAIGTASTIVLSGQSGIPLERKASEMAVIAARTGASEYLPICGGPRLAQDVALARDGIDWSAASRATVTDAGLARRIDLAAAPAGPLILPILYYPFLAASTEGAHIAITCDTASGFVRIDNLATPATVLLRAEVLPAERLGFAISGGAALALVGTLFWGFRRRGRR